MAYRKTQARVQHSEAMREKFLKITGDICREEGVGGVTVRRIVSESGSSTGNFYFYFSDKEDLLRQMVQNEYRRAGERIDHFRDSFCSGENPLESLVFTVYAGLKIALEEGSLLPLVTGGEMRELSREEYRQFFIHRTEIFFQAHPELLQGVAPETAALLWQGAVQSLIEGAWGVRKEQGTSLIRECIRWNCRALGLEKSIVEESLVLAEESMNPRIF